MEWETDEETETVTCNNCGADVYADADRCPACGHYLLDDESASTSQPKWVILTVGILLTLFAYWVLAPLL